MKQHRSIVFILAIAGIVFGVAKTRGGETQSGDWTIRRSDAQGKVEFSLMDSRSGHHFHYSSDWPASEFSGLDFAKPGRQEVHFTIARDAGKFECEGFLHDGEGAGLFHFLPDAKYPQEMKSLGFEKIDGDKQFAMAIRSEEHTSELQSLAYLVCRLLLEKKKTVADYYCPHRSC